MKNKRLNINKKISRTKTSSHKNVNKTTPTEKLQITKKNKSLEKEVIRQNTIRNKRIKKIVKKKFNLKNEENNVSTMRKLKTRGKKKQKKVKRKIDKIREQLDNINANLPEEEKRSENGEAIVDPILKKEKPNKKFAVVKSNGDFMNEYFDIILYNSRTTIKTFFIIQLLEEAKTKIYFLFYRWGKIDSDGSLDLEPYFIFEKGKAAFIKLYTEKSKKGYKPSLDSSINKDHKKTENKETKIESIKKENDKSTNLNITIEDVPIKYVSNTRKEIITLINGLNPKNENKTASVPNFKIESISISKGINIKNESNPTIVTQIIKEKKTSRLDKALKDVIDMIFNMNLMNQQMKEIGYDSKKLPFDTLKKETLKEGYEILKEIEDIIEGKKKGDLYKLSYKFYSRIPHNFAYKSMTNFAINNKFAIRSKVDMIDCLYGIEKITKIVEESFSLDEDIYQTQYNKLNCNLRPVKENEDMNNILKEYLKNASSHNKYQNLQLIQAYEINRPGEDKKFKDFGNRMLLWHGSRITNIVNILSSGLRITPFDGPVACYLFGKGIYFSDIVSQAPSLNDTGLMLLCEVSIGEPNELFSIDYNAANLPEGKNSTKGCGIQQPNKFIEFEGIQIPIGEPIKTNTKTCLPFNEFIVYNEDQVKLKYLLKVQYSSRTR